jgi:uncharacterized protein (DUF433 family)
MNDPIAKQPSMSTTATAPTSNGEDIVVRTERGLTIRGTRKTLYSIMDYIHADWSPKLIKDWLDLTDAEIAGAMAYINSHRDEVEREYKDVLRQAEEIRRYWEERNRNRPIPAEIVPDTPQRAALRAKLDEWKKKLDIE